MKNKLPELYDELRQLCALKHKSSPDRRLTKIERRIGKIKKEIRRIKNESI